MRYKAKSIAALQLALGSLPDKMRVEVEPDIEVSAKTVGELRKVTAWPETLAVTTPQERHADSAVKVSKVSVATRTVTHLPVSVLGKTDAAPISILQVARQC